MMDLGTDLVTSILSRIAWAILVEYFRVSCISLTSSTCLRVGPGTKFYDKRARVVACEYSGSKKNTRLIN